MTRMERMKINFIQSAKSADSQPKKKRRFLLLSAALVLFGFIVSPVLIAQKLHIGPGEIWQEIRGFNLGGERPLKGEAQNRVNILLLGMGGEGHEGAYLTDTIIIASLNPLEDKIALLSIPRDLLVEIPDYGWRRVNNINAFAEINEPGTGAEKTAQQLSSILNLPIHYYIRADFEGFKKIIDELGGVRVYVERSFTDASYPTDDFKYQTVSFSQGWQTMDGDTALKFARSRHGTNGESTDFARSYRQQKILLAVKDKIFSFETVLRPSRAERIVKELERRISTNIQTWEAFRLAKIFLRASEKNISLTVLDDSPSGILEAKNIEGAFVLLPKNNDWQGLQKLAYGILEKNEDASNPPDAVLEIQNGTYVAGLAAKIKSRLEKFGFTVNKISNAPKRDFQKTIIYDFSGGKKIEVLRLLQKELNADVSLSLPAWLQSDIQASEFFFAQEASAKTNGKVDFLIILGADSAKQ